MPYFPPHETLQVLICTLWFTGYFCGFNTLTPLGVWCRMIFGDIVQGVGGNVSHEAGSMIHTCFTWSPYYHVCPDILSLLHEPPLGNGCGSPNGTNIQLFLFVYLPILYLVQRKGVLYKVTSKSRFIQITWWLALTHIMLVRDCFPPSTASVRYRLPAVVLFKFLSVPPLLSITNSPWTYVTRRKETNQQNAQINFGLILLLFNHSNMFRPLNRSHHQGVQNPWELQSIVVGATEQ